MQCPNPIPECVYEADWLLVSHAHHDHIDDAFPLMRRNPKMRTNVFCWLVSLIDSLVLKLVNTSAAMVLKVYYCFS